MKLTKEERDSLIDLARDVCFDGEGPVDHEGATALVEWVEAWFEKRAAELYKPGEIVKHPDKHRPGER